MSQAAGYTAHPVFAEESLVDVEIHLATRKWKLLGPAGVKRETALIPAECLKPRSGYLPVFIGSGTGAAIRFFMQQYEGPFAVLDKEASITALTNIKKDVQERAGALWVDSPDLQTALKELTNWQLRHGSRALKAIINPAWLRLDRDFYATVQQTVAASEKFDFWSKVNYPRFQQNSPRILLITSQYFLMGEVVSAFKRMGIEYELLSLGDDAIGQNEFVEHLLTAVIKFKPDFALTINHLGVDREGILMELLERLQLPLASWFVDNPHLILYLYNKLVSPWTALFTWDADNLDSLKQLGFKHVFHLPLGTDPSRFVPSKKLAQQHPLQADVSFVGNSMVYKVAQRMKAGRFPASMLREYKQVAAGFSRSNERDVRRYLKADHPNVLAAYEKLPEPEQRLAYETMITWEATRQYRSNCVRQTLIFNPLIVGDKGWQITFKNDRNKWRSHKELSYYSDLPWFYPLSAINFNCTSKQMKGAVNQRVFDVPACGAFVLTDWRYQMDELFEPQKEVAFYSEPKEAADMIRFYLANPSARNSIASAARKRILNEHTYEHRLQRLIRNMQQAFG
ncbi:CgeB family protein [Oleidesulfovibrio sp.]|uniref:CgeB family protein n=1 Tax=Oleidesulfovibrio sp. TaxID=2909707 RepID=UPI003A846EF6